MTEVRLLYVTTGDLLEARKIATELLNQGLVACANIYPQMESIYQWKGQIESSSEVMMIFKTKASLVSEATNAIEKLHSYETPCVLSLRVESGSEPYLKWLNASCTTRP